MNNNMPPKYLKSQRMVRDVVGELLGFSLSNSETHTLFVKQPWSIYFWFPIELFSVK